MPVKIWFYYLHYKGDAIAKANTELLEAVMQTMGFRRITKGDYLKVRKMLRDREKTNLKINITGKAELRNANPNH